MNRNHSDPIGNRFGNMPPQMTPPFNNLHVRRNIHFSDPGHVQDFESSPELLNHGGRQQPRLDDLIESNANDFMNFSNVPPHTEEHRYEPRGETNPFRVETPEPERTHGQRPERAEAQIDLNCLLNEMRGLSINFQRQLEAFREEIPSIVRSQLCQSAVPAVSLHDSNRQNELPSQVAVRDSSSRCSTPDNQIQIHKRGPSTYRTSLKVKDLPKFNGKLTPTHPVEFLQAVKVHFSSSRVPDEIKFFELTQLLEGKALAWYNMYKFKNTDQDFEHFCVEFLEFFWGEQAQDNVRGQLFKPNQYRKGSLDMATYFMKFVHKAQYLTEKMPESVLVSTIVKHFPAEVRLGLHQSRCRTIEKALEALRILDEDPEILNLASAKPSTNIHQVSCDTSRPPPMLYPNDESLN